ncbi:MULTISPECIES: sugar ABC transporter permease [unclassified Paenibacillus]|uniref:carbohydrate ABC transporter permease n=1 Tax=unclassified Paenibacillus TaxID=185978 RepID=UPI002406030D|nr:MULTISPECIES: sugar ABC transporter permease [unclassified Paenibacillus]MDF9843122.1 raffinose/stachyose/melibiose transport system permease protein [Paenibacillus sp. PastF-2]MDF9849666.1 raffinose/stachyose/melibiose transport system permease protein [Paenibacillus sp. PastM-2]MDF9856416.1 raffinose/stachyose/melibiose transport system permease protein [Paenibacillus sp. PastF-1]MDH6481688.1 raffinose/stachyose/melibiose transport system permease protein [Paenibacillus sp. PastH-2]MDH650
MRKALRLQRGWSQQIVFLGPCLLFFLTIVVTPFFLGFYYSSTDWNGLDLDKAVWTGAANWKRIFLNDDKFWESLLFTLRFTVVSVVAANALALLLAFLLMTALKTKKVLRTIFFMPNVIGGILLGYIWQFIFTKGFATIGEITGISFFQLPWLGTPSTGFWGLVIVFVWQTAGYMMVIYIAALAGIPKDLIEAARIDGARAPQLFRSVYVPLIMPAITICLFLTTSNAFKMFDLNLSLTKGGPGTSTQSLAYNIYAEALINNRYGLGTAKALLFFVAVSLITVTQVWVTKRKEVSA